MVLKIRYYSTVCFLMFYFWFTYHKAQFSICNYCLIHGKLNYIFCGLAVPCPVIRQVDVLKIHYYIIVCKIHVAR